MGYYSSLVSVETIEPVKLDSRKLEELHRFFGNEENDEVYGFYKVTVSEKHGVLKVDVVDYFAKFYDSELFCKKLSGAMVRGKVKITFVGEDGDIWGYCITPQKVEDLIYIGLTGDEYESVLRVINMSEIVMDALKETE